MDPARERNASREILNPVKAPPPVRTLELVRAKYYKVLEINDLNQTFFADVFYEFKIRGGAHDEDLIREGEGAPSNFFPKDTLRPSARWLLGQFDFSNSVHHKLHHDTCVQVRGDDIHLRYRAYGEFAEQLELESFPFDTQELTTKLIIHCVIGGVVSIEIVPPDFKDDFSDEKGVRKIPKERYKAQSLRVLQRHPLSLSHHDIFKVDSFHLHNVWDLCNAVYGHIEVHAGEFPQLAMTCLVRRKPDFYLQNVAITMIVLEAMAFSAFAIEAETTEGIVGRVSLALTLVLTCGIYRQTNAQFSPPVACLTLLDEYMLVSSLIITGSVFVHAILALEYRYLETTNWEPWLVGLLFTCVIVQHVYTIYYRVLPALEQAKELGFREEDNETAALEGKSARRRSLHHYSNMGATKRVRVYNSTSGRYTYVTLDESAEGADKAADKANSA